MDPRLNPHLATVIPPFDLHGFEVKRINAIELINIGARFDLVPKLLYATDQLAGKKRSWVRQLYRDHILCFNGGEEGDGSGKRSPEQFMDSFDALIESLKSGFDSSKSLIPIDSNLTLVDGAHRLAAAAALCLNVEVAIFPTWKARVYDIDWFVTRGLSRARCESAIAELPAIDEGIHVAVLYPASLAHHKEMLKSIAQQGTILHTTTYNLDAHASIALIREIYFRESWLGSFADNFAGAHEKADSCCGNGGVAIVVLFRTVPSCNLRTLKESLRDISKIDKHSIHMDDGGPEALRLARTLIPQAGQEFIATSLIGRTPNFDRLMLKMGAACRNNKQLIEQHCIDGGAVLAAYGLRDTEDLDVISTLPVLPFSEQGINRRVDIAAYYGVDAESRLWDPTNHFWHQGVCFLVPALVAEVKRARGEGKDAEDLSLLGHLGLIRSAPPFAIQLRAVIHRASRKIRKRVPLPIKKSYRFFKKLGRRAVADIRELSDYFSTGDLGFNWKGITVFYRRGDSLIKRIRRTGDYEPHVTIAAQGLLAGVSNPLVLDIGSNIGLFAWSLMDARSDCTIEAFDPGPLQHHLLTKTIVKNNLELRLKPHQIALGDMNGTKEFAVHQGNHSSGDGFLDTQRAGSTHVIKVECRCLDTWWIEAGKPKIHLIKIDAEGAESMILNGAKQTILACRPNLLIEINAKNLKPYGLQPENIRDLLNGLGYKLLGCDGSQEPDISSSMHGGDDMFIAMPHMPMY